MTSTSLSSKSSPSGATGKNSAVALTAGGNNIELGKYRILRLLGQGGFGITYLAQHMETGQEVVIKENLHTDFACRDQRNLMVMPVNDEAVEDFNWAMESFLKEARLLMQLDHPNIVKVQDAFPALGTAYYVMPWVGGSELGQAAPAPGEITEAWLAPILRQLLEALQYLHGQNLLHRDIKPSNILMSESGAPVFIDFGAARAIISEKSATKVGSPGYTPIEQVQSRGKRGPWTDIYALGATCYRLITGHRPPQCEDRMGKTDCYRPLAPQAELYGRFTRNFLATIDKALAIWGEDRWQSAQEWLATLPTPQPAESTKPIIITPGPQPISAPAPTPPAPAPTPRPIGTLLSIKILLAAMLLLLLGGGWFAYHTISAMQAQMEARALAEAQAKAEAEAASEAAEEAKRQAAEAEAARKAEEEAKRREAQNPRQHAINTLSSRGIWSYEYDSKLRSAAEKGDIELVRLLLTAGADVNTADEYDATPLWEAADRGHTEVVRLLLAAPGIDVNKASNSSFTPLYRAASRGHTEVVRLLLAAPGIDVTKATEGGWTPLYLAAKNGHTEMVRLLLAAPGIDVNKASTSEWSNGYTPLRNAASEGHTEVVRLLLAAPGIDVNKADKYGVTPLYRAAYSGHTEVVRMLLAAPGIEVNKANKDGETPLYWAARNGHAEVVRLLLAAPGIDVNKANKYGWTPLDRAETEEIKRMLRAAGAKTKEELKQQ